jgi:hypothetical protein
MRSNQHSKRSRGRSRHRSSSGSSSGGGGGNPLGRVYESNGPDVKVRGTAQTIAEKYLQLGRDSQSAGDIVMSESYYQHAEHYLRILAAAQAYNQQMQQQYRRPGEEFDEDDIDESGEGDSQDEMARTAEQSEQPGMQADKGEGEVANPVTAPAANREYRSRDRDREKYGNGRYDRRDSQTAGATAANSNHARPAADAG